MLAIQFIITNVLYFL